MLTSFNKYIKLDARSLTQRTIWRLRFFSILALFSFPIFTALKYTALVEVDTPYGRTVGATIILCVMLPVALSRLANMIFLSDQNLDEWELQLKKGALSFGYRSVLFLLLLITFFAALLAQNEFLSSLKFRYEDIVFMLGNVFWIFVLLPIIYTSWVAKPLNED